MKRLFFYLLIFLCFLIPSVSANTALNFQQPADFVAQVTFGGGDGEWPVWVQNISGGNNYISLGSHSYFYSGSAYVQNSPPGTQMGYAAATVLGTGVGWSGGGVTFQLFDSQLNALSTCWASGNYQTGRVEMKVIGLQPNCYLNGNFTSNGSVMNQYPTYVQIHANAAQYSAFSAAIDDVIWGSSQSLSDNSSDKYVYNMPETVNNGSPYYYIMKDYLNPFSSGFYAGNGTLIYSNYFYSSYSKSNSNNDTISLEGFGMGSSILDHYTGNNYTESIKWDLVSFFNSSPNYGLYVMHSPSSLVYSDLILYIGAGGTINWDQDSYAQGDAAILDTVVQSGAYWDTTTYNYRIDVIDVYGDVVGTYPVTTQTQTTSHLWADDQDIGAYYAALIAAPKVGGDDIWLSVDLCNVDAFLTVTGYVHGAETELPIPNATVNITQGTSVNNRITGVNGTYNVTGLAQGAVINTTVGATGYRTYVHEFTPLRVGTIHLNFTLIPTNPTVVGIGIGGVDYDTTYGNPIPYVLNRITNTTYGESYPVTGNSVGYYIGDNSKGASLTNGRCYDIIGSKTGFLNSTTYVKCVVGS